MRRSGNWRSGIALCALAGVGCAKKASSSHDDGGAGTGTGPVGDRGTVRVTVLDSAVVGAPAAGAAVVFVDPDGTVVQSATTDASGTASAEVRPGASVTALIARPRDVQATTVLGIAPGDDLVLGTSAASSASSAAFTIGWPAAPGSPAGYAVYGPCGLAGTTDAQTLSMTFGIRDDCKPDTTEILICAQDAGGNSVAFDDATGVALAGGSAAMADQWSSGFAIAATYTHLMAVSSIRSDRHVTDGNGFASGAAAAATGMTATALALIGPRGATARMESALVGPTGGTQIVRERIAGDAASYQLDVGGTLLAWLDAPALDAGTQRFHVAKVAVGMSSAPADLLELDLHWQRADGFYTWKVFGPDGETIALPALPASIGADLALAAGDDVQASAVSYDADTLAGYDAVRGNVGVAISEAFLGARSPAAVARISKSSASIVTGGGW